MLYVFLYKERNSQHTQKLLTHVGDERDFNPGYSLEGGNWQDADRGNFQQRQQRRNRYDRQGSGQNDWFNRERENVQRGNNVNNGDWQQGRMGMDDTAGWERGSYGDSGRNQGYGPSSREFDQNIGNSLAVLRPNPPQKQGRCVALFLWGVGT